MLENNPASPADASNRPDPYSRLDNGDDALLFSRERLVPHLDSLALETVSRLIENLVIDDSPVMLDLMASWDSHIPDRLRSCRITGLGLNETELKRNEVLSEYIVYDLNRTQGFLLRIKVLTFCSTRFRWTIWSGLWKYFAKWAGF